MLLLFGVMRGVAIEAADGAAGVGRLGEVRLPAAFAMAGEAAGAGFLPGMIFKHIYFCFVATAGDVLGSGAVASFAALLGWTACLVQRSFPVRSFCP